VENRNQAKSSTLPTGSLGIPVFSEFVPNWKKYLNKMSLKEHGDHITLQAAANLFEIQIVVLSCISASHDRLIFPSVNGQFMNTTPTAILGHYAEGHGEHYVCLQPCDGYKIQDVFNRRISRNEDTENSSIKQGMNYVL
jgi:hypothetical protein